MQAATLPHVIVRGRGRTQGPLTVLLTLVLLAILPSAVAAESIEFVVSIHPLQAVLQELTGDRAKFTVLIPPGASPHTYEPRPSALRLAETAPATFFVKPETLESFLTRVKPGRKVEVFDLIPAEFVRPMPDSDPGEGSATHQYHGSVSDPHFWTDPLTVQALLPALVNALVLADPGGKAVYQANAQKFTQELSALDSQCREILAGVKGRSVILFHPSFCYLLHRYGLELVGTLEPFPGKEASPKYLSGIIRTVRASGVRAIFTEPQLARRPAEVVAEAAGVPLFELDPNGGLPGRMSYAELILYNARVLKDALQ